MYGKDKEGKIDKNKVIRLHMSHDTGKRIKPRGSRAGVMYGLPKVHKEHTSLRPIISAVKTYNYELAKYLDEILKPLIDDTSMLNDTYDFVNKIGDLRHRTDCYMVSFDVESLFTNVPTLEKIDILLNQAFKDGVEKFHNLTRSELKKFLVTCTQESNFQFNGKFYDQIDGVAMGSPLGPFFANAFMSHFETKHKQALNKLGVTKWYRYVDDIFATIK